MWAKDQFGYNLSILEAIGDNYHRLYSDGMEYWVRVGSGTSRGLFRSYITHPLSLAEYKADFDMAWKLLPWELREIIRQYVEGHDTPGELRRKALRQMRDILNEGDLTNRKSMV